MLFPAKQNQNNLKSKASDSDVLTQFGSWSLFWVDKNGIKFVCDYHNKLISAKKRNEYKNNIRELNWRISILQIWRLSNN